MGNPCSVSGSCSSRRETRAGFGDSRTEDRFMKRLLVGALVALGLAGTAAPALADCYFELSCSRHMCFVHTRRNRCLTYHSYSNPLPCAPCAGGYCGPTLWNSLGAYAPHGYAVAAQPAAAAAAP